MAHVLAVLLSLAACIARAAETPPKPLFPDATPICSCEELMKVSLPNTTIDSAAIDPSDGSCRVTASVTHPPAGDRVKVFIGLPVKGWNGRFRGNGGGGFSGGSAGSLRGPVAQGFAAGATDTGHEGGSGRFALDENGRLNWQAIQDNAYLGIHDMTVVGKALTEAFYGKAPRYSYFVGGSTGGRQGLMEAQRFPADYDGIISACPAIYWHRFVPSDLWPQVVMLDAKNFVPKSKLDAATAAAVAACDALDGVGDGVIDDPARCDYDPKALVGTKVGDDTFTEADADVVRRIWEGPRGKDGAFIWHGLARGTDLSALAKTGGEPLSGRPFSIALEWFQYFLKQDPKWDWTTLTPEGFEMLWKQSVEQYGAVIGTDDPDLSKFRDRGGRIIIYHGLADELIPADGTIDYYKRVQQQMGGAEKTAQFARLFLVPGVNHGFRGAGGTPTGLGEAIIRWVEEGQAPTQLTAETRDKEGKVIRTRRLFPYPAVAKYSGTGGTDDAANFVSTVETPGDVHERDSNGHTSLHRAALKGDAELVVQLLKQGASASATNRAGATPLLYAVANVDSVRALLDNGADVNRVSQFGTTPLIAAARYPKSSAVVRLLLERGADPAIKRQTRFNALEGAANAGDVETFRLLLAAGFKPPNVISPAMMGHREIVEEALAAGADLQFDGGHAGHALNFALYGQQPEIAKLLIERGANLTARSPGGEHQTPPILWAAYNESGDVSVARLMIEKGADVNLLSALGHSALDWARARHNKALEKVLLEAGARESSAPLKQKNIPNRELPADPHELNALLRDSATAAVRLLQRSSDMFLQSSVVSQQTCVACHHQTLPAVAFAWARERGLPVDEISMARQVQDQVRYWKKGNKISRTYEMIPPQPDPPAVLGYGLLGLSALAYPADSLTDAMIWYLAATQRPNGSWPAADYRPPMEDGPIQGAALALRALQNYPLAGREAEMKQRVAQARDYLAHSRPITFNQEVFKILGLVWAGANQKLLGPLVGAVIEKQRADGGWAQLEGLPSDAWATGQALVALHMAGSVPVSHAVFQKGIHFLLRTQFSDGSWYVRSRAWPFQPHFESDFPHGKDQWISAGGTAWATMALLLTQPTTEQVAAADWLSLKVPPRRKVAPEEASAAKVENANHQVNFARDIEPLLQRSCAGCHGGERKKGGFSIASREALLKGGQSGEPLLLPGQSDASRLIQMVTDHVEDLEMPPLGKRSEYPALTPDEVALVKTWIDAGLPWKP